jgi:hypothetical protein
VTGFLWLLPSPLLRFRMPTAAADSVTAALGDGAQAAAPHEA